MGIRSMLQALAAASALVACQGAPAPGTGTPPGATDASSARAVTADTPARQVRGVATYRERIKAPPGAMLQVEARHPDSGAVLASTTVRDVAGPPIRFTLSIPPAADGILLQAALHGPDGAVWFATPAPVALPRGDGPIELPMRRIAAAAATVASTTAHPSTPVAHWECGELGVMSRTDAGSMRISFNGRSLTLAHRAAQPGPHYSDGAGTEFTLLGDSARLTLAAEPPRDCVRAAQASPWNRAMLDGARFRAVGNEPGWAARVAGSPAVLDAQLDYGEQRLRVGVKEVADGFVGRAEDGTPVRLRIRTVACADGMSGQRFEAEAVLEALGRTYRGCGADLRD